MVNDNEPVTPAIRTPTRMVNFSGTVTLGNVLIMLGMLAGGGSTIFVIGTAVQRLQDSILSETEIRSQSVLAVSGKIDALTQQETRDVSDIKLTMSDMRADLRSLLMINPAPVVPRR